MIAAILRKLLNVFVKYPFYAKALFFLLILVFFSNYLFSGKIFTIPYGYALAELSAGLLNFIGFPVAVESGKILISGIRLAVSQRYLSLYWIFLICGLLLIITTEKRFLIKYGFLFFLMHILLNLLRLNASIILHVIYGWNIQFITSVAYACVNLIYLLFILWVFNQAWKTNVFIFEKTGIDRDELDILLKAVFFIILIVKSIMPLLMLFQYRWLSDILLKSVAGVLSYLGYSPHVFPGRIAGQGVGIRVTQPCLGIGVMLVYSSFIYLTGKKVLRKLICITSGIIVINVMNVARFVVIYAYLVNTHKPISGMVMHDIFNGIVYITVFLIWVIWIERFSDHDLIRKYLRNKMTR